MAEALGAAVLTVSVDDTQLRAGLLAVQTEAQRTAAIVRQAFEQAAQAQRQPAAGPSPSARPPLPPPVPAELLRGLTDARQSTEGLTQASRGLTAQADAQVLALNRVGGAAGAAGQGFGVLAGVLGRLGLATSVAGVAAFVGNQITQLDSAAAAVRTLGVDSDELTERMRLLSVELGNNVSQLDLTKAAYDVASSGFASAGDATEVLRAAALGAKGGFADINDVARGLTGVLNAYGLSVTESTRIVDQFAQTQNDGVITIRQYVNEIGNVASIAAAAGIPLEQLNAAIATATLRGVPVQQTFTGLRQAISSILKPSEQAASLARALGIDFSVTALQAKGFSGLLADIQAKGGASAEKLAVLLGSVEAQAAVQPLLNDRLGKFNELLGKQANAAGVAGDAMNVNTNTISGGLQRIGTGFSNLATTLDSALSPLFKGFIGSINEILLKLNQVSALAPEKVQARERQATELVGAQLGPLGIKGSGFFGAVTVRFGGKTYTGSATGVRESIIQELLRQDIAAAGRGSNTTLGRGSAPTAGGGAAPGQTAPVVDEAKQAADLAEIRSKNALQLEGIQARIAAIRDAGQLEGVALQRAEGRRAVEEKIRAALSIQADLNRELAKPIGNGVTNLQGSQSATRIAELEGNLANAAAEVRLAEEQASQSLQKAIREAQAANRAILDTYRARSDSLRDLGRQGSAAIRGLNSPIDVLSPADAAREARRRVQAQAEGLGNGVSDASQNAERAARALRDALDRRAGGELVPVDQLVKLKADADVAAGKLTVAGIEVGRALRDGATDAAKQLRDAQGNFNDVVRGGFENFTKPFQDAQIALARQELQPLIDRGVLRQDIPRQTTQELFAAAGLARAFQQAENQVALATNLKASADAALANSARLVENSTKMGLLADSLNSLAGKDWTVNVAVQPPQAALPGV